MSQQTDMQIPDWKLERLLLGELPAEQARALRQRVESEPELQERLAALEASNDEILAAYPADSVVREIEGRRHMAQVQDAVAARDSRRGWLKGIAIAAPVLAGSLAVLLMATPTPPDGFTPTGPDDGIILKGGPQLVLHRQAGDAQELLAADAPVARGDILQISYRAADQAFGIILSIDGRGSVTRHLGDSSRAPELQPAELTSLTHSYELDDAPAFERFFLVTANTPFELAPVLDAAAALARDPKRAGDPSVRLDLAAELSQTTFIVRKVESL